MSEREVRQLLNETRTWLADISAAGWLTSNATDRFEPIDKGSPADLFEAVERPLVIGLFGGTGAGKSSLLNRLADAAVARTGVVRPTSMEITAYLHQSIELTALPDGFPMDQFSETRHHRDDLKNVVWVDMPDFDSEETGNRDQVLQWLPHIDLLVYVVTPERYRDEAGWRILLEQGYQHGWLFVINQWDRAEPVQYQDFTKLLQTAGFDSPMIFRTICDCSGREDDFTQMAELVGRLAERRVIEHLHDHGWLSRLTELSRQIDELQRSLGGQPKDSAVALWQQQWQAFSDEVSHNQQTPLRAFAAQFAPDSNTSAVSRALGIGNPGMVSLQSKADGADLEVLWDQWSRTRLQGTIDSFQAQTEQHGIPAARLLPILEAVAADTAARIPDRLRQQLNATIARPGPSWQIMAGRFLNALKIAIPGLVAAWAVWRLINGFIAGGQDPSAYVGLDMLINAALLAGLGWLVASLASTWLRPSLTHWIAIDLNRVMQETLAESGLSVHPMLEQLQDERRVLDQQLQQKRAQMQQLLGRAEVIDNPELKRLLLPHPLTASRPLD